MNKRIVFEGLDGSTKSTQIQLLKDYCKNKDICYYFIKYPCLMCPEYGDLIAGLLRGELGENNPYLIANLFADNRKNFNESLNEYSNSKLKKGIKTIIIIDRYVGSNVAYCCAKLSDENKKNKLKNWILHLEYDHNKIIKPSINLLLKPPFKFIEQTLKKHRTGKDRNYLHGKKDIYESDLEYQKQVEKEYMKLIVEKSDFFMIDCSDINNNILSKEVIHEKIINLLNKNNIL